MPGKLFAALLALTLAACAATGPTGYGPATGDRGFGYTDMRIESDRYRIVYRGSGGMAPGIVEDYALARAAEVALDNGYDWFRIAGRDIERDRRGGVSLGGGVGTGSYGRRSSVGVGVGGDFGRVGAQDFFTVRLEVLLGEGESPDEIDAYDARDVLGLAGDNVPAPE